MPDDTTPKAARATWKQGDVLKLADAHRTGGMKAAMEAFPDRPVTDVAGKLESLGLLGLASSEKNAIEAAVQAARVSHHPPLFVREAIAALRKVGAK